MSPSPSPYAFGYAAEYRGHFSVRERLHFAVSSTVSGTSNSESGGVIGSQWGCNVGWFFGVNDMRFWIRIILRFSASGSLNQLNCGFVCFLFYQDLNSL